MRVIEDLIVSSDFPEAALRVNLSQYDVYNMEGLIHGIIATLDDTFGEIKILSGKRGTALNGLVGGSKDSDHLYGAAIDFTHPKLFEIYNYILDRFDYRQLILYENRNFIHYSINHKKKPRKHMAWIEGNLNGLGQIIH